MADTHINATMGIKAANKVQVHGTLIVELKLTRRYIWMMKLKYIWAVIRADFSNKEEAAR